MPDLPEIFLYIIKKGLFQTLLITALGLLLGFVIGMLLALMRVYGGKELGWFASGYEKLFRGIPVLVLIFIFAYGLPGLYCFTNIITGEQVCLDFYSKMRTSVILALGLRSAAYQSQIFRGAILSVNPGQMEAARALGMSGFQAFRHIVMPQALRLAVPSWSNEYAVVIKDSSFAYAVALVDMTKAAYDFSRAFQGYWTVTIGVLAIIYFLFTYPVTRIFGERQSKKLKELGMGGG